MSAPGTSFATRAYYRCKRFLPFGLRRRLRRIHARRVLRRCGDCWPIDPHAGQAPDGWPGWPDGREFAFVLTHDVESQVGVENVRQLAELEMELGFRSSFNFVPEGPYHVPPKLREWLVEHGFEVGVHDLRHDGSLFRSEASFERDARRINHHLEAWGAVGFRAGFMLRQLEWIRRLDIVYDSSTFDTDPFEPQPDGCGSIFPFRVPPDGRGEGSYIELPYTLPQDSTLFLLLGERSPEIWLRKTDWIAGHRGMAMVDVHPDYLHFGPAPGPAGTYPADTYREFLSEVKRRFAGRFWQPLPRQVADHAALALPHRAARVRRQVCMVTFSHYESDNRVIRYAEALAARGDSVDVLALRRDPEMPREEMLGGVRVVRIQDRFDKSDSSKLGHLLPVLRFIRTAERWLRRNHRPCRFDLLHIHNIPDFVVFAGWFPKWRGAKVILDIHDIVPELYTSKFGGRKRGLARTALLLAERLSACLADHVIIANHLWRDRYAARTRTDGRCTAIINHVDAGVFKPGRKRPADGRFIVMFPGGLQWHQGVDVAIEAFRDVRAAHPQAEFHIYGDGIAREALKQQAADLGLDGCVKFFAPRPLREIAAIMADADLGVVPKRADSFGNEAYSTKIMEFMAAGVPVVVSETAVDRHYFDDGVVRFVESGNPAALGRAISEMLDNPALRHAQAARALEYAGVNCWEPRRAEYLELVDSLWRDAAPGASADRDRAAGTQPSRL